MLAVMLGRARAFQNVWPWNSSRGSVVVGLQAQLHTSFYFLKVKRSWRIILEDVKATKSYRLRIKLQFMPLPACFREIVVLSTDLRLKICNCVFLLHVFDFLKF